MRAHFREADWLFARGGVILKSVLAPGEMAGPFPRVSIALVSGLIPGSVMVTADANGAVDDVDLGTCWYAITIASVRSATPAVLKCFAGVLVDFEFCL